MQLRFAADSGPHSLYTRMRNSVFCTAVLGMVTVVEKRLFRSFSGPVPLPTSSAGSKPPLLL